MKIVRALLLCLPLALLTTSSFANLAPRPRLPLDALPVPIIRQSTEYSCGASALLSIFYYWGVYDGGEASLFKPLATTEQDGTEPNKIVEVAEQYDLKAYAAKNLTLTDLRGFLAEGMPVILDIQAWPDDKLGLPWTDRWDDGHYVVLIAMDRDFAYFMDPSTAASYGYIPLTELLDRWHDMETRNGVIEKYEHYGIAILGDEAITRYPTHIQRIK